MKLPYMMSSESLSVLMNGRMRMLKADHPNYNAVREELRKSEHDVDMIGELVDISTFVARVTHGDVQISDGQVRWKNTPIANVIGERLLAMLRDGDDLEPLALFLGRLMNNPVESAREELYLWLEAGNAPITPDGHFLAFKKVRSNYKDVRSGTFDNSVGKVCSMERSMVDPNRHNHCSRGLHFAQYGYLSCFSGERTMIVQIDPADVVSIPTDYQFQKGRTWRYTVVGEVQPGEAEGYWKGINVDGRHPVAVNEPLPPAPVFESLDHVRVLVFDNEDLNFDAIHVVESCANGLTTVYDPDIWAGDDSTHVADSRIFEKVEKRVFVVGDFVEPIADPDTASVGLDLRYEVLMVDNVTGHIVITDDDGQSVATNPAYFVLAEDQTRSDEEEDEETSEPVASTLGALPGSDMGQALNQAIAPVTFQPVAPTPRAKSAEEVMIEERRRQQLPQPRTIEQVADANGGLPINQPASFTNKAGAGFTAKQIKDALTKAGSNDGAARDLGVSRSTLQGWRKRMGA